MAVIFYLSGTGNSMYAAKSIAQKLEQCRMEGITGYLKVPYEVQDEVVGIVCPVYCMALPDNSIVFPSPQARQEKLLRNAPAELGLIARNIKNKYDNYQHLDRGFLWKYGGTAAGMWVLDKIKQFGKLSCADDKCVGCGICAEVCPAGNITMAAGKPAFGSECVHCFGCAHWCPQNAISLGRLKPDQKTRYKHPEITPAELAVQKERKDEI